MNNEKNRMPLGGADMDDDKLSDIAQPTTIKKIPIKRETRKLISRISFSWYNMVFRFKMWRRHIRRGWLNKW